MAAREALPLRPFVPQGKPVVSGSKRKADASGEPKTCYPGLEAPF